MRLTVRSKSTSPSRFVTREKGPLLVLVKPYPWLTESDTDICSYCMACGSNSMGRRSLARLTLVFWLPDWGFTVQLYFSWALASLFRLSRFQTIEKPSSWGVVDYNSLLCFAFSLIPKIVYPRLSKLFVDASSNNIGGGLSSRLPASTQNIKSSNTASLLLISIYPSIVS